MTRIRYVADIVQHSMQSGRYFSRLASSPLKTILVGALTSLPASSRRPESLSRKSNDQQLADEEEAIAIDAGLQVYFVYHGWMERWDVPRDA